MVDFLSQEWLEQHGRLIAPSDIAAFEESYSETDTDPEYLVRVSAVLTETNETLREVVYAVRESVILQHEAEFEQTMQETLREGGSVDVTYDAEATVRYQS